MYKSKSFFLLLVLQLAACSPQVSLSPSKDLIVATVIPIGEIQPFTSRLGVGANLIDLLYRPLARFSGEGKLLPELAKEMQWEDDFKSLRVVLKEVNANDVLFTFETAKKLKGWDFPESLKNLDKIEIVSPEEVVFKLKKFDRAFLALLSELPIISSSSKDQFTGEFVIEKQSEQEVILKRKKNSPNLVNRIIVQQISSPRKSVRELAAGKVDITFLASEGDFKVLTDIEEIQVGELKSRILYVVLQNFAQPGANRIPWGAINQKIDRDSIMEKMGESGLVGASLPVPKEDKWWGAASQSLPTTALPQIPLSTKSATLSFLGRKSRDNRLARILKRYFEEIGIQLTLKELTWENFVAELTGKKFDWILFPYTFRDTLVSNWGFHSPEGPQSSNLSNYSNAEVDRYLEEARFTHEDLRAQKAFGKAMVALSEEPPGLFLFWLKTSIVYRKSCSGFKFNTNEFFSSLKDVRCEPSAAN